MWKTDGNIIIESDSLGGTETFAYDAKSNVTSETYTGPGGQQLRIDMTYNLDGEILAATRYANTPAIPAKSKGTRT